METNKRNQRSYSDENEFWDQNQGRPGRENDFNQSRNYPGNYGDENYDRRNDAGRRERQPDYRSTRENENNWGDPASQYYQRFQNAGRRFDDDNGNNFRNRQREDHIRSHDATRGYGNAWDWSERNWGNRDYDDQRSRDFSSRNRNQYRGSDYDEQNRNWIDRTRDEVSSWFGDDDAERRRREDKRRSGEHRGKGPKDYQRSSDRIREDVSDRLSDDSYVDASEIEVRVTGNEVILAGTVDSKEAKRRAEDIAESVSGVANVQNQLRVASPYQSSESTYQVKTQGLGSQQRQDKERHN